MKAMLKALPLMLFSMPAFAATVSIDALMQTLIMLVVVGLIFWCIWWFIGYVGVPEPFDKVIRVIVGLVALIFLVSILLGLVGGGHGPLIRFR